MADEQEEQEAAPLAAFAQVISVLPAPGTVEYWLLIEQAPEAERLPLEVLSHCLRAHLNEGARRDAERIFVVILTRLQTRMQRWAHLIAQHSHDGGPLGLAADLEQECAFALWKELSQVKHTYLLVNFGHTLKRIEQHVAHRFMQQVGQWKRAKVAHPLRIPQRTLERLEGSADPDAPLHRAKQLPDPAAEAAFSQVEFVHDLNTLLHSFNIRERIIVYDRYWRGLTEAEIAEELQITDRTVRNALHRVLTYLRARYEQEE